jgi:hypothetical protein
MENTSRRSNTVALVGVGLMATPLIAAGSPAFAAGCQITDPAATEVLPGVCEVQFAEGGTYSFTAPSGVAKMTAIIVGAGGGAMNANAVYGGGGGEVIYVASVDVGAPLAIEVGVGVDGSTPQAGSSSVNSDVARGGHTGTYDASGTFVEAGGYSGNGNAGWADQGGAPGGGAGGVATSLAVAGPGVSASAIANDADMWPALGGEPEYGPGGPLGSPVPGTPAGAGAPSEGDFGNDGLVILRWTSSNGDSGAGLVNTGLTSWSIALGAIFALGLFFVATGAFRAKNDLQFAGSRARLVQLMRVADARLKRVEGSQEDDQI